MLQTDLSRLAPPALRASVCTVCSQRPAGSESLSPQRPRTCEGACPLFHHLPQLVQIARQDRTRRAGDAEHAVHEEVCCHCADAPTAGDFCAERLARSCPLSRYGMRAVEVLESLSGSNTRHAA